MPLFQEKVEIGRLSVLTKTQNEPKQDETSRNDPKLPKTTSKNCKTTQNVKTGEIWNFLIAFVFQVLSPNAQIWVFWIKKFQLFNLLTKFCL